MKAERRFCKMCGKPIHRTLAKFDAETGEPIPPGERTKYRFYGGYGIYGNGWFCTKDCGFWFAVAGLNARRSIDAAAERLL